MKAHDVSRSSPTGGGGGLPRDNEPDEWLRCTDSGSSRKEYSPRTSSSSFVSRTRTDFLRGRRTPRTGFAPSQSSPAQRNVAGVQPLNIANRLWRFDLRSQMVLSSTFLSVVSPSRVS